jgi:aspartate/methionine/tyrosine aminotransferase
VLVSCEVYMEMARPEQRVHAFALAPNAVSIGSLTKAYGLGPLRIGWILLGEGLAGEIESLRDLAYLAYVDPPTAALRGGLAALERLAELTAPLRRVERESRPLLERWLRESARVESTLPAIGLVAFPRVRGVEDTRALQRWLAREHEIDVVPGEFFGRAGHLRVGCGLPPATLAPALERLEDALAAYRPERALR